MISANTPIKIGEKSQEALVQFLKQAQYVQTAAYNLRENFRDIDLAYQREQDITTENQKAKVANKAGDPTKFRNIIIPVVMPQIETAVTYQSSVFLTGYPIFPVVSTPENQDAATMMETILADQAIKGAWTSHLMQAFRNAFKYNLYAIETGWKKIKVASLETDVRFSTKEGRPTQVVWEGNFIRNLDMYNTIWDLRVPPHEVHLRGEYAGYTELMGRVNFKAFLMSLEGRIAGIDKKALESGLASAPTANDIRTGTYYVPDINPSVMFPRQMWGVDMNWMAWAGLADVDTSRIQYKNSYQVTTIYARILPSDFGIVVPESNTVQIWKFVFVNNSVLILAERQTNAHNNLPILMGQSNIDGLSYQTKSLAQNVMDFQSLASASWNSFIANIRRSTTDRVLYDPSRISSDRISDSNPAAKIPVRPAAYGKNIAEAVYQFPFRGDNLDSLVQMTDKVTALANNSTRQNPARQGQFVKGNKTRQEFNTVMDNATDEDQMIAIHFEGILFTPLKEILKYNILQFQGAGTLLNRDSGKEVEIDPVALRQAVMSFKVSDGLIPSSKVISTEALRDGFQTLGSVPALAQSYNLGPMFSYLMKVQGANIGPFEKPQEQVAYEQALAAWQQTVVQIAKTGAQSFPPQPTPEQFNYNPAAAQPQPSGVTPNESSATPGSNEPIQ